MSISFPTSPTPGQIYQNWVWNATAGTWDAVSPGLTLQMRKQIFTATGVYTPSPGMFQADVECVGGGGGGGAVGSGTGGIGVGGGGGAGGYSKRLLTSAQIGSSQTVTIGAFGAGGAAAVNSNGANGGSTSFGSLCTANGGGGGPFMGTGTVALPGVGLGAAPGVGDIAIAGQTGDVASYIVGGSSTGFGGASGPYGAGGGGRFYTVSPGTGQNATGYGAGGAGGICGSVAGYIAGGNGAPGLCIVTEYCWITQAAVAAQAASGARVLLMSQTVSTPVAFIAFTSNIDTTYDIYEFDMYGIQAGAGGAGQVFGFQCSPDHGTTWDTGSSYNTAALGATSYFGINGVSLYQATAEYSFNGNIRVFQPFLTTRRYVTAYGAQYNNSGAIGTAWNAGVFGLAAPTLGVPVNGFRFQWTGGINTVAGTIKLYGVVK